MRPTKIFHGLPKIFPRPTKNFFSNISYIFTILPIQLRCFNNIWPFFTKVAPLLVWFLHPWLSATNGFYRNYQELGGGQNGKRQKIILGGHFPPPCPPLAPPLNVAKVIGVLRRLKSLLPHHVLVTAYKSLILPHFDYCSSVWGNLGKGLAQKLQKLQNRAARIITGSD